LVDADPRSLRVLEVSLRKAGYNLATANDGTTALSMIASSTPDLILTDTRLPGLDGFALVESVRRNPDWGSIPIMFLSSDPAVESKVRGLTLGVEDYLTKPIYIKEIVARINISLSRFERENFARGGGRQSLSKTRFTGSLGDMGLVDLLQTIEISRKSGVLEVHAGQRTGMMTFREGQILDAELGSLHGERALYRILLFSEGDFEIDFRPVKTEQFIRVATQGLLMEGMRRLDEWGRLLEQIPPISSVMEINEDELGQRLAELPDEINAVLRAIDGQRSLEEVIDAVEADDLHTLGTLSKLFFEGVIQPTGRSRTLRPPGAAADGELEHPEVDDAHIESGVVPATTTDDRAIPDDHAAPVPARASVVPGAEPAEAAAAAPIAPPPAPIPAEERTIPDAAPPIALTEERGTINAPVAPPPPEPVPAPPAVAPAPPSPTFTKTTTLIGPGFDASKLQAEMARAQGHQSDDSEDAMSKKNRKKNRGGEVSKSEAPPAAVQAKPAVEAKPVVVDKVASEAEAQSNVIQFPAKRAGSVTQIAVNDDVASATVREDSTSPRLRKDEEEDAGTRETESAPAPKPLPGELPKVVVDGAASKRESAPAPKADAHQDRKSRREEKRQKKTQTSSSGEIRALGTGEHGEVTDDFFRKRQSAPPHTHDDFSDLGPVDELPKQSRQYMYATVGIVIGFGLLIGGYVYYQQMVLPPSHELGHGGPVEMPHATVATTPPETHVAPPPETHAPETTVAIAPEATTVGEDEVVAMPAEDAAQVAIAEEEEEEAVAVAPPASEVPAAVPPAAGETYESVLAEADAARRRPSTAIPLYEHAIQINPIGSEALAQLSFLLLNRGRRPDLEQARDYALRATQIDATSSLAWLVLGAARDSLGDRAGAREAYRNCVDEGQGQHVRECRALAH
jgi:DNA-binding response OmpR family regulator